MTTNQFRNLLAFLCVMFNEDAYLVLRLAPDYIVEKFVRYAGPLTLRDDDGWNWGMHPILHAQFLAYLDHWALQIQEMEAADEELRLARLGLLD